MTFREMDPTEQKRIASAGGKAAHRKGRAHEFMSEQAKAAGKLGGQKVSADRAHMAEIGRKGGRAIASIPGRMKELGRKGGRASAARFRP